MASPTLTRPAREPSPPPPRRRPGAAGVARLAFALLCLAFAVGFFVFPTYPNYDSYYSLLWGREVLDGTPPSFEGFRVPTEHPLAIAVGAALSLLGDAGDRVWIALTLAAFLALVWGLYRLGAVAFTPLVGLVAAALLLTRFDFGFLAARGYVDVGYLALVVWAAVLEVQRPRRGAPVLVLLALAGMLRPEAWLLAGLYWAWVARRATWGDRLRFAALVAAGPLVWCLVDVAVTGDPLFSLTHTSTSAEELGRRRSLAQIPAAVPDFLAGVVKLPVFVAGLAGLLIAGVMTPRRAAMPLVLLAGGVGTFGLIGVAGLSVIDRYLLIAALAILIFAAVAVGGWTMLMPGTGIRRAWAGAALVAVVVGTAVTATRVNLTSFATELRFRGDAHTALEGVLARPAVARGLRCGPLTLPNHKLVPDARWVTGLPAGRVLARADPRTRADRGVALYVTSRYAIFKHALTAPNDSALVEVPPEGWRRVATTPYYTAYARC